MFRNRQWITGKQSLYNGSPLIVKTTKQGFDEDYTGADKTASIDYHVELTLEVIVKKTATFDTGNDEKSWNMVYRNNKFTGTAPQLPEIKTMTYLFSDMQIFCY